MRHSSEIKIYRGRFAPSPSGHLHFGSLLAATASYLQARQQNGEWWLRIEDIDPPREVAGSSKHIIKTLKDFGFEWDNLSYQSQRQDYYQHYLQTLLNTEQAYFCGCSRKDISQENKLNTTAPNLYPGTCRTGLNGKPARAVRFKVEDSVLLIEDAIQGKHSLDLSKTCGDFILKRADGFYSYQLAVAIDDSIQDISQVVRGYDLFESSFNQKMIQQALGLHSPEYAHIPVAISQQGLKLSKLSAAKDIATEPANKVIFQILQILGQQPPNELQHQDINKIWKWTFSHWELNKIPQKQNVYSPVSD